MADKNNLSPGDLFRATADLPTAEKGPAGQGGVLGLMPGEEPAEESGKMPGETPSNAGKMPGEK